MAKLKELAASAAGWLAALALAAFWLLSRRKAVVVKPVHVERKPVPEKQEDVNKEARRLGIIK